MDTKRLLINLTANLVSFFVSAGISFLLTPYITEAMGNEAYGFISLGNSFVNYMTVITIAINTMSARFIAISWYEKNYDAANRYYASVLAANIVLTAVLAVPSALLILFLERVVKISAPLAPDVKLLWALMFSAFFVDILTTVYSVAPFVKNRLELAAGRDIAQKCIRAVILLAMFSLLRPHVWYYGLAVLIAAVFCSLANFSIKRKLLPEMNYRRSLVSMACVRELLRSGVWSSVGYLSSMLIEGFDLLVADLFISASSMGVLSIAKTVPTAVGAMLAAVQSIFVPEFTRSYAEKDAGLLDKVDTSIKIMSVFSLAPISVMVVLGKPFFSLWVPSQDSGVLYILSIITFGNMFVAAAVYPLYSIFTVTNHLRVYSLSRMAQGALGLGIEIAILFLLPRQQINAPGAPLGLYTIAGVSSVLGVIFALAFVPPYAAHCLRAKKTAFYPAIFRAVLTTVIVCAAGALLLRSAQIGSWAALCFYAVLCAAAASLFGFLALLKRSERRDVLHKLRAAVRQKRR